MRNLYTLLLTLALPLAFMRLWWRGFRAPAYRRRWGERLGRFAPPPVTGGLWIHAVSVGEVQAVVPLVQRLREQRPDLPICITTTTPTGSDRVRQTFGDEVFHVYFPYDLPFAIAGFLGRVRPLLLLMVETEIWPNLLAISRRQGLRTLLANARLSARSARGYARLGHFARDTLACLDRLAVQSDEDAARFIALGVDPARLTVTGSIKFDMRTPASIQEQAEVMQRSWGHRPVWVAASTHEGEDEQLLAAHRRIMGQIPDALLVLVPRHPERFERVAGLVQSQGFTLARRTGAAPVEAATEVFLGDTMGELPVFIGAADVVFIGGSLVPVGGHNVLEAAALGRPVVFGPQMFNFAAISRLLIEAGAARQVNNASELAGLLVDWLSDASERSQVGEHGRRVVAENSGALDRLQLLLDEMLGDAGRVQ